jgi:hypothetical protein
MIKVSYLTSVIKTFEVRVSVGFTARVGVRIWFDKVFLRVRVRVLMIGWMQPKSIPYANLAQTLI